jgi:DNA-binding NarL/FixJ family response regulator
MLLLEGEPSMVVSGITDRADGFLTTVAALHPNVLLLDWRLAGDQSIALVKSLSRTIDPPNLVVLSSDQAMKVSALAAGADVFIDNVSSM